MQIGFPESLATLGLLLVGIAAASGLVHRTVLSIAVLSVFAGMGLQVAGVVSVDPSAHAIIVIVEVVLLLTLFSDGLLAEQELVRRHWRAPARALVIAMPLNAGLLAAAAVVLFGLPWQEALVLGFVLSPTDPVITSSVVSSDHVPPRVRHTLNLESGLNDGLALPFVLFFLALTVGDAGGVLSAGGDLALESAVGLAAGAGLAFLAGRLLDLLPEWAITRRFEGLYALGLGLAAFGVAELVHGNGLLAAFAGGATLALVRHEMPELFHEFNENVSTVLQIVAFAVFGALVIVTGFAPGIPSMAAFVVFALLVARPASVLLSFIGIPLRRPERLFVAWFGPKGIASMLFALIVLNSTAPDKAILFDIAAATILASIVAHGLTDTVASTWIARRLERAER